MASLYEPGLLDGCNSGFEDQRVNRDVLGRKLQQSVETLQPSWLILTWAAWEAKEEQVFIQARSLATWSAVDGVYLVMSGVHTAGLTGAPAPQPVMLGVLGVVAPKSGLMFAAV